MQKTNNKGFGAIGIVLVLVTLVIVAGAGWYVLNKNSSETVQPSDTETANDSNLSDDDRISKLLGQFDDKFNSLTVGQSDYIIEERYTGYTTADGEFVDIREPILIKTGSSYKDFTPDPDQSFKYRTTYEGSFDAYSPYIVAVVKTVEELNKYAVQDLNLTLVDSHTVEIPTGTTFSFALYSQGDVYCQISGASDGGDVGVSCISRDKVT